MYITCPECRSSFVVTPEQLGPSGRKVKCSKCQNIWHAQSEVANSVKIEPIVTADSQPMDAPAVGINLPALLPIKLPPYLCCLPILLIALIICASIAFYSDTIGLGNNHFSYSGITINDVNIEYKKEAAKVVVHYKIMNNSDSKAIMPLVRIRLFDKDHRVLQTHIENASVQLNPKQYVSIKTEFVSIPPSAQNIDITIGNKIDFLLR